MFLSAPAKTTFLRSMEAGTALPRDFLPSDHRRLRLRRRPSPAFPRSVRASSSPLGQYRGPQPKRDLVADWVADNDGFVRSLPIYVGGSSLLAVLFNRTVSGIAPVADASSAQSRADLLTLGLAVTNVLAGLVWLSIRPKPISVVEPLGVECRRIRSDLPESVVSELLWQYSFRWHFLLLWTLLVPVWESLSTVTCCRSLAIVYDGHCIMQIGMAAKSSANDGEAEDVDANKLMQGSLYQGIINSRAQSYLANLSLYPGRSELPFLPFNTQAVILQPLGDKGIAVIGGDTIRGFTTSDQTWVTYIGEKLDAALAKYVNSSSILMQERV